MTEPLGNYGVPTEPEWLLRANAGITTKTEIPRIIPPLPEGDTTDLKVWKEYWKQHDTAIRNATLDELRKDLQTRFIPSTNPWSKGRNSGLLECCNIIDSLRTQEQP